jgi:hypothetical protein
VEAYLQSSLRLHGVPSICYAIGYGLDGRDFVPGKRKNFFPVHSYRSSSVAHTASHPVTTEGKLATSLYPQKLAPTSLTSGDRSVGVIRSRTKATELVS